MLEDLDPLLCLRRLSRIPARCFFILALKLSKKFPSLSREGEMSTGDVPVLWTVKSGDMCVGGEAKKLADRVSSRAVSGIMRVNRFKGSTREYCGGGVMIRLSTTTSNPECSERVRATSATSVSYCWPCFSGAIDS